VRLRSTTSLGGGIELGIVQRDRGKLPGISTCILLLRNIQSRFERCKTKHAKNCGPGLFLSGNTDDGVEWVSTGRRPTQSRLWSDNPRAPANGFNLLIVPYASLHNPVRYPIYLLKTPHPNRDSSAVPSGASR